MDEKTRQYYTSEFEMLTNAHFQISQQITTFFQYSLLILSAPFALLAINNFSAKILSVVFLIIGTVGLFVMLYLSKMRTEALLYARQINRIRNVLYSNGIIGNKPEEIHNRKILFSQDKKPNYADFHQFGYIVIVLNIFSSSYFSLGTYKVIQSFFADTSLYGFIASKQYLISVPFVLFFSLGLILHRVVSQHSENGSSYYKRIIGVDIDGVLNKHEEQFVKFYNGQNDHKIRIEDITTLPVSKSGIIHKEDERKIFVKEDYWTSMPVIDGSSKIIKEEIYNLLGYKVFLFTFRDWKLSDSHWRGKIKRITKKWLKENKLHYNKLKFESGNFDRPVSLFSRKYRTRFYFAQKYKIRFFVEDNYDNATRLSKICEYVFLINHKYNENADMPYNIIRVDNWEEIYELIKKLN